MQQPLLLAQQACSFFLARLEAETVRLKGLTFPGHDIGPRKWINLVAGLISSGRAFLDESRSETDPGAARRKLQEAEDIGERAYKLLAEVSGTDATQIPHEIIAPFHSWIGDLRINNTTFFRAAHLPNYELWTVPQPKIWTKPSPAFSKALGEITWPVLIVAVPARAMDMLPHFAVVAHELGHAIHDLIKPDLKLAATERQACEARIEARLQANGTPFEQEEQLRLTAITDNWIEEIKADAVGHLLVGPAYFFALCGFLELALRTYGIAETHPPSELRRQLLMQELAFGSPSFADVFLRRTKVALSADLNSPNIPACPRGDDLFSELLNQYSVTEAAICTELIPYIASLGPIVFAAARSHLQQTCPDLIYTSEKLDYDLGDPLTMLSYLVPPIESNHGAVPKPLGLASILNIGWAALLTRLDQIPDKGGDPSKLDARRSDQLHQLLLKAVELSEASRLWSSPT